MNSPKCYDAVLCVFVVALLCANLIGPGKACAIGGFTFAVGSLFFPVSYIASDALTEVYGYARARRAVWIGAASMLFAVAVSWLVLRLPVDRREPFSVMLDPALALVFGNSWRVIAASLLAFLVGDLANAFVLAKLKVRTAGRHLWVRTIGSTIVGQGLDSLIFFPMAFAGIWTASTLATVVLTNWAFKVSVEVLLTPVTYRAVRLLKRHEGIEVFDRDTNFSPFRVGA